MNRPFPAGAGGMVHDDSGHGLPLLFLHGWLMSRQVWYFQDGLADCFRVITPDLPGHGETGGVDFSYAATVADLVALVDHLGLERLVIVGWSMGSQIAVLLASRLKERVAGLALVGGTPRFCREDGYPHGVPLAEARSMGVRLRRSFNGTAGEFYRGMFSPSEVATLDINFMAKTVAGRLPPPSVALAALDELIRADLRVMLAGLAVPVMLMHGDADRICPAGASRYMHGILPHSRLHLFPDTGHAPFLTRPEEFNSHLSRFCQESA